MNLLLDITDAFDNIYNISGKIYSHIFVFIFPLVKYVDLNFPGQMLFVFDLFGAILSTREEI